MNIVKWQRPALTNWPAFGRLSDLRDEIDRLFESPLSELTRTSQLLSGWTPVLDVHEDKDNFTVKAELPGMKKEDIEVSLHDGSLSISGERKTETKHEDAEVYRAERFLAASSARSAFPPRSRRTKPKPPTTTVCSPSHCRKPRKPSPRRSTYRSTEVNHHLRRALARRNNSNIRDNHESHSAKRNSPGCARSCSNRAICCAGSEHLRNQGRLRTGSRDARR